jgi:hypothetical protein
MMVKHLELLFVQIPEIPERAPFVFHPVSRGQDPVYYKPHELKDIGTAQTEWLRFFERILVGLYWKLGRPVPYAFRVVDGTVRSLDGGCLKWLRNRQPPEVEFQLGESGLIMAVKPSSELQERYQSERAALVAQVSAKKAPSSG